MLYNTKWTPKHQADADKVVLMFMQGQVETQRAIKSHFENRLGWCFRCPNDSRGKNKRSAFLYVQLNDGIVVGLTGKCHRCNAEYKTAAGLRTLKEALDGKLKRS